MAGSTFTHFGVTFPEPPGKHQPIGFNLLRFQSQERQTLITYLPTIGGVSLETFLSTSVQVVKFFQAHAGSSFFDVSMGKGVNMRCMLDGNAQNGALMLVERPSPNACGFGYMYFAVCSGSSSEAQIKQISSDFARGVQWAGMKVDQEAERFLQRKQWHYQSPSSRVLHERITTHVYRYFCPGLYLRKTDAGGSMSGNDWDFTYTSEGRKMGQCSVVKDAAGNRILIQIYKTPRGFEAFEFNLLRAGPSGQDLYVDKLRFLSTPIPGLCRGVPVPSSSDELSRGNCDVSSLTSATGTSEQLNGGAVAAGVIVGLLLVFAALGAVVWKVRKQRGVQTRKNPDEEGRKDKALEFKPDESVSVAKQVTRL